MVSTEVAEVQEASLRLQVKKKIDVALWVVFSPGDRAEDAHAMRDSPGGEAEYVIPSLGSELVEGHSPFVVTQQEGKGKA